jgi:hypothetical protein
MKLRPRLNATTVGLTAAIPFAACFSSIALGEDTDGAYGRLDGDLMLQFGAGLAIADEAPLLELDVHALYLSTAGIYFRYTEAFGQESSVFDRTLATGVDVRPLFLARYARNLEKGPARLDLFADSVTFEFGAAWQQDPKRGFREIPAFEIGLGFEFPLLADANGPFLGAMGLLRFDDLEGKDQRDLLQQGSMVIFTFSWHQVLKTGLVDFGDQLAR